MLYNEFPDQNINYQGNFNENNIFVLNVEGKEGNYFKEMFLDNYLS